MLPLLAQTTKNLTGPIPWLPPRASSVAGNVDFLIDFILWITVFFTILILGLMVYFAIKYRHKKGGKPQPSAGHSTTLELTWTIIPTILVVIIFFLGFREYLNMIVVPPNTYEIRAHGYMWGWTFFYPNGHVKAGELHVPEDTNVRIVLTSEDVIHALYVPNLRLQKSNVPGRYNKMWFRAKFVNPEAAERPTADGKPYTESHIIYCNQYCGTSHSEMLGTLVVHRKEDFEAWLAADSIWTDKMSPLERGKQIYTANGCVQCHSLDGSKGTGPTWKDAYGHEGKFTTGESYKADEAYIREAILYPDRHIVAGFAAGMPSYAGQLKDYDIDAVIAYMKSLSKHFTGGDPNVGFKYPPGAKLPDGTTAGPEGKVVQPGDNVTPKK